MHESHIAHSHDTRLVRIFEETVASPYSYWFVCLPEALKRAPVRAFHDWLFDRFAGTVPTLEEALGEVGEGRSLAA